MSRGSSWNSTSSMALSTRCGLYLRGGGLCAWCTAALEKSAFNVDHVVPRAKGGGNAVGNLVPACSGCNWAREDGRLEARLEALGLDPAEARTRVDVQRAQPIDRAAGNALALEWYPWHRARQARQVETQRALRARRREERQGPLGGAGFPFGELAAEEARPS